MERVRLGRVHATYHLQASRQDQASRLDRLLGKALVESLEPSLDGWGVSTRDEICVRAVHVPVRLRLDAGDSQLAATWGLAIGAAVRGALEGDDVVRYTSREQALVDFAAGVAAGDLRREWAWRELGLWRGPAGGDAAARSELVRALFAAGHCIVPVLTTLARAGALPQLASRLSPSDWTAMAEAALAAHGLAPTAGPTGAAAPTSRVTSQAARLVRRSTIARDLSRVGLPPAGDAAFGTAVAALAALEADPGAAAGPSGPVLIGALAAALWRGEPGRGGENGPQAVADEQPGSANSAAVEREGISDARRNGPATAAGPTAGGVDDPPVAAIGGQPRGASSRLPAGVGPDGATGTEALGAGSAPAQGSDSARAIADPGRPGREPTATSGDDELEAGDPIPVPRAGPMIRPGPAGASPESGGRDSAASDTGRDDRPYIQTRSQGTTSLGGLLFLLNPVAALSIPARVFDEPALEGRELSWTLHSLALRLVAAEPADPAVLAFAGLAPDSDPPLEDPPGEAARKAIEALATELGDTVREALERMNEPVDEVLRSVCARPARIWAEPGWIEAHMSMDEVDIAVRRAGLDQDPGWLPWLGVVVRFVYG